MPAAARESFRTGKVALLIDRAERAADLVARQAGRGRSACPARSASSSRSAKNGRRHRRRTHRAILPHGGGWLVGINGRLTGTQLEAALDFAKYLANPENSNRLRAERTFPMLPVRTSARWARACPTRPRPRTSTPGSGRTRSAGPCWPSESCPACASPAPTVT